MAGDFSHIFGMIKEGIQLDIQRSDGRIHSATVVSVKPETRSVCVEWREKSEVKGKELDIEVVLTLNPHFKVQPGNQRQDFPDESPAVRPERPTIAPKPNVSRSAIPSSRASSVRSRASQHPAPRGLVNGSNGNHGNHGNHASHANGEAADSIDHDSPSRDHAGGFRGPKKSIPVPTSALGAAKARPSQCLKEVEKIQKKREERRAKQQELRDRIQEQFDPTDSNWEFKQMIAEFRDRLEYTPISNDEPIHDHQICVSVRKRPLNRKETGRKEVDVITTPSKDHCIIHEPKLKVDLTKYLDNQTFRFDYVFDENSTNEIVYKYTARPLIATIFEGGMATCFAYGQTGSGKTHTMGGDFSGKGNQDCSRGIYGMATRDVFKLQSSPKYKKDILVSCSFFEIYSGKVFDLLNKKQKLRVLEDGKGQVQVVNLKEESVENVNEVLELIAIGNQVRTSGTTSANQHSSRSHAVFQIILRKAKVKKVHGKFSLIDLAGNERGADTSSSDRNTRMEGAEINKSLLALKECIRALGRNGAHLPFRASTLTKVLRDSFIGSNSKTCMIAMISPGNSCCEHTLNTLRYADRVKELGPSATDSRPVSNGDHPMEVKNPDLALLATNMDGEVSSEMLTLHEAMNHLQDMEEQTVDEHKSFLDDMESLMKKFNSLYERANQVDYDVEDYVRNLESLIEQSQSKLGKLKGVAHDFHKELQQEEQISKTIKNKRPPVS